MQVKDSILNDNQQLQKVEFELKSEHSAAAAAAAAAGTNSVLKEEEKPIMNDKFNTLFPEVAKNFAEGSDVRPKDELVIPNINVLAKTLDRDITPKEL